ncbi:MAG: hypothetical protein PHG19_01310 [Anaerotignum sp.]|nr:hypothetical protein [Anaerotignum sp.]
MKKDYSTKKKAAIVALSIVAVCLAGGLFYYTGTMGGQPQETPVESTAPVESQVVVPEIKPEATPKAAQTESNTSEAAPSEKPDTSQETVAPSGTETPAQSKPSDGKPKSPTEATPPSDPPAETNQGSGNSSNSTQEQTQPQGGEKDGKIYVPGFGWIDNEGGGSDVHEAPNAGTGEPVGDM